MRRRPTKEQFHMQLEQMVSALRNEILDGQLLPNDYLPPEKALAERFGMSNNSIRAGLEQLVSEGWIEKIPRVGNRVTAARPPVKLKLLCNFAPFRNLQLTRLLDGFHRLYPWISVEAVPTQGSPGFGTDDRTLPADAVLLENYQFQDIAENRDHERLEPLIEKPGLYAQATDMFRYEGLLYMQPLIFSPIVLCYNKAHFRENGMLEPDGSWTWDDLMRAAEQLTDGKGRYGFCFHVPSKNRWPVFLLQSGERFEWDGGRLRSLYGTKLLEGMKMCKRIIHNRKAFPMYLSENHDDIDRMFLEGKVSMTLSSYMGMNGWKESDIEFDVSPIPRLDEMRTLLISLGIGISRESAHKEETLMLVDYLVSEQAQQLISRTTLSIPTLGTLHMNEHAEDKNEANGRRPSRYMMFREIMSSFRPHEALNVSHDAIRKMEGELKAYWADLLDEDELCDRLGHLLSTDRNEQIN
ncbi:extracellular solute-binding protein [Paenibacillus hodogayensis]|uniref:Extracellular solute-binding protein n=1 Tax=Paenibacillus hodogayensis TaxID=279208 RepID=A0ABV5W633_9BACL